MLLYYNLLARQEVRYAYLYRFGETFAGVLMIASALIWLSVFKAVYIDRRELRCACVGGNSNVPLGFVSLTENLMMAAMGIWMGSRCLYCPR